jgi:hypothetical protein
MFWFTATHPETGEPLEVEAQYTRARRGQRNEFGLPLEPDEPETIVILKTRGREGHMVENEAVIKSVEAAAWRCLRCEP